MKKIVPIFSLLLLFFVSSAFGQKLRIIDGELGMLKGQKKINVEFVYDGMGVGSFSEEKDYVDKKRKDYEEKEKGRGDTWYKAWTSDRKTKFEPQFDELFSKYSTINAGNFPDAIYTMIFKTTFTEPGFNVYVARKNASINGVADIVETANKSKVLCTINVNKAPGRSFGGMDFDSGTRIQESYAVAGKALGKLVAKSTKK